MPRHKRRANKLTYCPIYELWYQLSLGELSHRKCFGNYFLKPMHIAEVYLIGKNQIQQGQPPLTWTYASSKIALLLYRPIRRWNPFSLGELRQQECFGNYFLKPMHGKSQLKQCRLPVTWTYASTKELTCCLIHLRWYLLSLGELNHRKCFGNYFLKSMHNAEV
jgi:hypothetical protein